ncbi:MAG: hypothetical protein EAZ07_03990 [Cytophagales bacterium]|nr:MAG: hypothetical protein EAZ07_03990 [Cytophagales bacterium]
MFTSLANAQQIFPNSNGYYVDALRYSQKSISGTSRTQGMAGVGVATGADISSAQINPAGLGLLRKGEMTITGSLGAANTTSNYFGSSSDDVRIFGGIPNFGFVFSNAKDDLQQGDFRGGSFAISFSKIHNFQNQININGVNPNNSIIDDFAQQGNRIGLNRLNQESDDYADNKVTGFPDYTSAAYYSRLIDQTQVDTFFLPNVFTSYLINNVQQSEIIKIKNGMYQWDFAYGGNYKDKIYFGGGIGLVRINYRREGEYNEVIKNPELQSITILDKYSARGGGINFKGGIIVRPIDALRVGLNFTTPTYFSVNEVNDGTLSSVVNGSNLSVPLLQTINNYSMFSPMTFSSGVAYFFGKHGFVSADLELVDYRNSRLINSPGKNFYEGDNRTIKSIYQTTANIKIGAELRYESLRFRLGYAFFGDPFAGGKQSPFAEPASLDRSRNAFTLGFGIRQSNMYFDVALIAYPNVKSFYQLYNSVSPDEVIAPNGEIIPLVNAGPAPVAEIKNTLTTFNFTIGTYFGR